MIMKTSRIILRPWKEEDIKEFRALNADGNVMRFFPSTLTEEESDQLASTFQDKMRQNGFGMWVLELPDLSSFAGVVGLNIPSFNTSLVEVGWRLHSDFWGRGFATEAAAVVIDAGFSIFSLDSICAFTSELNIPSERVMQRLGMKHCPEKDFNHPFLSADHPLAHHVFYNMTPSLWEAQRQKFPFLDHEGYRSITGGSAASMHIRKEVASDHETVYSIVKRAFESAEHADGHEQELVNALRKGKAFIPDLSLVAEVDGKVVGHIMFTKATVDEKTVLALAPLSVLPEYQRKGIGKALIEEGHKIAKKLGYTHSIVLGSERYYSKSGYSPAEYLGIKAPFDAPRENFMVCILDETGIEIHGTMEYAPEFGFE